MTSRQRVLAALAHRPTDRVPRLLYEEAIGYTPPVERLLREKCARAIRGTTSPWTSRGCWRIPAGCRSRVRAVARSGG